jgi:hypothetical protein
MRGPIVGPSHPVVAGVKEALTPFPSFRPTEAHLEWLTKAAPTARRLAVGKPAEEILQVANDERVDRATLDHFMRSRGRV